MQLPRAILFDLDDTLAESFRPPTAEMIGRLKQLLDRLPVAVLSGASYQRMETDLVTSLLDHPYIDRCYIFPNSAAQCYISRDHTWEMAYDFTLTPDEHTRINTAIEESVAELDFKAEDPRYQPQIIDRDVQIAYAAVGVDAPAEVKRAWDPDQAKRRRLKAALDMRLPDFEILIGGTTTIDITRKGINKAYGVAWLAKQLGVAPQEMIFIGDTLYEGGNDAVVIPTGIQTRAVTGPQETIKIIDGLLALTG